MKYIRHNNNNNNNNNKIIKRKWSKAKPTVNSLNKKGDHMLFYDKKKILALASSNQVSETDMFHLSTALHVHPMS